MKIIIILVEFFLLLMLFLFLRKRCTQFFSQFYFKLASDLSDKKIISSSLRLFLLSLLPFSSERMLAFPTSFQFKERWSPRWILLFYCFQSMTLLLPILIFFLIVFSLNKVYFFNEVNFFLRVDQPASFFYFLSETNPFNFLYFFLLTLVVIYTVRKPYFFWGPAFLGLLIFTISVPNALTLIWSEAFAFSFFYYSQLDKKSWLRSDYKYFLLIKLLSFFILLISYGELKKWIILINHSAYFIFLANVFVWMILETFLSLLFFHFYFKYSKTDRQGLVILQPQWIKWGWVDAWTQKRLAEQVGQRLDNFELQKKALTEDELKRIPAPLLSQLQQEKEKLQALRLVLVDK